MIAILKEHAENILRFGRDKYRKRPSPLFADGLDIATGEQVKWVLPGGRETVMSNLASQQNLFRFLAGMTGLTGDPKYKDAAQEALQFHFTRLADSSGLLQWGGHRYIDLLTLEPVGPGGKNMVHELKCVFPYYELMYETNPEATVRFIKAFWNTHVLDWDGMLINRHGEYGLPVGKVWDRETVETRPFRESNGLSFINIGNDLIYAAGILYRLTGDKDALKWARHLAQQYVAAHHPQTGLGAYQYTQPRKTADTNDDNITLSKYGDRAKRQFGPEFGDIALEGNVLFFAYPWKIYGDNALIQLKLAIELGEAGHDFLEWTRQGLISFAKYAYEPETNMIKPMFSDGKDLTGYVLKRNGYYGKAGSQLLRTRADCNLFLSYVRVALRSRDESLWNTARSIGKGNGLGDIGPKPGRGVRVDFTTRSADPCGIFALVDLYQTTFNKDYLKLGQTIAGNIIQKCFHNGYFTKGPGFRFAKFDAAESLALLTLDAAFQGKADAVPVFVNSDGFTGGDYQYPDGTVRNTYDWDLFE